MMYSPSHYKISEENLLHEVIEQNSFSTLIYHPQAEISHLPLSLEKNESGVFLSGHMARANPLWQKANQQKVTALFHGPHCYITPRWYLDDIANVPTWNYAVVHVTGILQVESDAEKAMELMREQVKRNEGPNGWKFPVDMSELTQLLQAITVFRIVDLKFDGKFKLSQKHSTENKNLVIAELKQGREDQQKIAEYMQRLSF